MKEMPDGVIEVPRPKVPLWRRLRAGTLFVVFLGAIPVLIYYAFVQLHSAVARGVAWDDRLTALFCAGGLLLYPGIVAWVFLRMLWTKWTTGRWGGSSVKVQRAAACTTNQRKKKSYSWWSSVNYWACWGNYYALDPAAPEGKRGLGWLILIVQAVILLACLGACLLCGGLGLDALKDSFAQALIWILAAIGSLAYPAWVAWSSLSRYQTTGSLRVSDEEMQRMTEQRRAHRAEERARQAEERAKPRREKIGTAAILLITPGLIWYSTIRHYLHHQYADWFNACLWTAIALYGVWKLFRPTKSDASESEGDLCLIRRG